jgi:hypothetical protein
LYIFEQGALHNAGSCVELDAARATKAAKMRYPFILFTPFADDSTQYMEVEKALFKEKYVLSSSA